MVAGKAPFVPAASLPQATDLPPAVHFAYPAEGGHAGFCSGTCPAIRRGWRNASSPISTLTAEPASGAHRP